MRRVPFGLVLAIVLLVQDSSRAQQQTWIAIDAAGVERGAFVPRDGPYTQGGPSVAVYLAGRRDVRMPDGQVLTGFDFIGWREGAATRVQVFALVAKDGMPNTYLPEGEYRNLARRDFATYVIRTGESHPITEMKSLGIAPMTLRAHVRTGPR